MNNEQILNSNLLDSLSNYNINQLIAEGQKNVLGFFENQSYISKNIFDNSQVYKNEKEVIYHDGSNENPYLNPNDEEKEPDSLIENKIFMIKEKPRLLDLFPELNNSEFSGNFAIPTNTNIKTQSSFLKSKNNSEVESNNVNRINLKPDINEAELLPEDYENIEENIAYDIKNTNNDKIIISTENTINHMTQNDNNKKAINKISNDKILMMKLQNLENFVITPKIKNVKINEMSHYISPAKNKKPTINEKKEKDVIHSSKSCFKTNNNKSNEKITINTNVTHKVQESLFTHKTGQKSLITNDDKSYFELTHNAICAMKENENSDNMNNDIQHKGVDSISSGEKIRELCRNTENNMNDVSCDKLSNLIVHTENNNKKDDNPSINNGIKKSTIQSVNNNLPHNNFINDPDNVQNVVATKDGGFFVYYPNKNSQGINPLNNNINNLNQTDSSILQHHYNQILAQQNLQSNLFTTTKSNENNNFVSHLNIPVNSVNKNINQSYNGINFNNPQTKNEIFNSKSNNYMINNMNNVNHPINENASNNIDDYNMNINNDNNNFINENNDLRLGGNNLEEININENRENENLNLSNKNHIDNMDNLQQTKDTNTNYNNWGEYVTTDNHNNNPTQNIINSNIEMKNLQMNQINLMKNNFMKSNTNKIDINSNVNNIIGRVKEKFNVKNKNLEFYYNEIKNEISQLLP